MYGENSFAEGYAIGRDSNNGYNNGMFGDSAWWIIILLIFGWWGNGNNGFGVNGGGNGMAGYELGKLATTNDVASGFSTSAIMSNQRDLQLSTQQGFADVQQTLCQGFSGINATVNTVGNQINQGICNLGYTLQGGLNDVSRQIADCCCTTQRSIDAVNYNLSKSTCDVIRAGQDNTQRILDYLTSEKISALQAENSALTAQLSQNAQTNTLISTLRPCPVPAYLTCSPFESAYGINRNGCGCGC